MTSHELARQLLAMPDVLVVGIGVGQGSNEAGNHDLTTVEFQNAASCETGPQVALFF
jgi:hypothetical protein